MICEECKFMFVSSFIVRIKSKYSKKGYVAVCNTCIKINEWENKPLYKSSNLEEHVENIPGNIITPTMIEKENGRSYLQYYNGIGYFLTRDELKFIVKELQETLSLDNSFDDFIEEKNKLKTLQNRYLVSEYDEDKFSIPFYDLKASKKKFNLNKGKWSFKCGNCSKKISVEDSLIYYSTTPTKDLSDIGTERACSQGCFYIILKDIIQNWLHEINYKDYLYTDNLEQQIREYYTQLIN